ncbi:MAG: DUF3987 domain-containing protein [Candidatus Kuenenia sp.]|nr:DUF3987 domain-containing protein [Candidatus Kuenenia hertensis]
MNKERILANLDIANFYKTQIPFLRINGKPNALGLCVFHNDRNPSLSVDVETGLFNCFSCGKKGDIFTFYQELHCVDFQTALQDIGEMSGMITTQTKPKVVAKFEYKDINGIVLYFKERVEPGREGRKKEFWFKHHDGNKQVWGRGCDPLLYNLPQINKSTSIIMTEGEAKADLLVKWGFTGTCLDGGANSPWKYEYTKVLEGKNEVVIVPDNDMPGKQYAAKIANTLHGKVKVVKVVELPGLQEKEDIIDWAKIPGNDNLKLIELIESAPNWVPSEINEMGKVEVVEEVDVFPEEIFPVDIFPSDLKEFFHKVSISMDIDQEVVAGIAMCIISASIGNSTIMSPKPGYEVAPFLWIGVVLPSGSGKSPVFDFLAKPIMRKQSEAYQKYKQKMKEYKTALRKFKKEVNNTEEPEEPVLEQYYISDTTVEALAEVFEHQPRGVLNYQDELSSLIFGMNQYKNNGNDRQHYLQLFNCKSWKINRKTGTKFIPNTGMSIIGGIQPDVVPLVFKESSFLDGFIQRFIFVCPNDRPMSFNRDYLKQEDCIYWDNLLRWCYDIPLLIDEVGFIKPRRISLDEEALKSWESFYSDYAELTTILPTKIKGFIPKLYLFSLKFAGILHIVKSFNDKHISDVVDEKTTSEAIELTKYFFGQVGKLLKHYQKRGNSKEYHTRIIQAIHSLQSEVMNGKLELQKILNKYNHLLPEAMHLTSEKISRVITKELGLTTNISTGGRSFLMWEEQKLKKMLKVNTTSSTSSTIEEKGRVEDVEKVEVSPDNRLSNPNIFNVDNSDIDL